MDSIVLYSISVVLVYMSLWYLIALFLRRNDIADIAWGLGFMTLTWALFFWGDIDTSNLKTNLVIAMVSLWALRLAIHIAIRASSKPEDGRYVAMRKKWKYKHLQAYTNVFLAQGFFMLVVSAPIILFFSDTRDQSINWFNILGLIIWIVGFVFEAVGDFQLKQFLGDPKNKGKIMKYGLWKYTRHPNYFGEISLWWGFFIFTLFTQYWYIGIIGPLTITYLILGVSGIPMLEKRYKGNKEYKKYQKSTNAFFPAPPKS